MYLVFCLIEMPHTSQSATAVMTVVLVVTRIFGTLNDPFMGVIVDNARSRLGKLKLWIALGAMLWGAATLGIFVDLGIPGMAFLVWFITVYLMWSVTYITNDISLWDMLLALSQDLEERERIGVITRIYANLRLLLVVVTMVSAMKTFDGLLGSRQLGWLALAALLVALTLGFQSLTLLFTRQQMTATTPQTPSRELV